MKHLNLVDLSEAMSSLYYSMAERKGEGADKFNSARLTDVSYDKMKVRNPSI